MNTWPSLAIEPNTQRRTSLKGRRARHARERADGVVASRDWAAHRPPETGSQQLHAAEFVAGRDRAAHRPPDAGSQQLSVAPGAGVVAAELVANLKENGSSFSRSPLFFPSRFFVDEVEALFYRKPDGPTVQGNYFAVGHLWETTTIEDTGCIVVGSTVGVRTEAKKKVKSRHKKIHST